MIKTKSVAGPNPYVNGTGFVVNFYEFQRINSAIAKIDRDDELGANDTAYALHTVITQGGAALGPHVHVLVFVAGTFGAGPNAWAEIGGVDMSGRTVTVTVDGE